MVSLKNCMKNVESALEGDYSQVTETVGKGLDVHGEALPVSAYMDLIQS